MTSRADYQPIGSVQQMAEYKPLAGGGYQSGGARPLARPRGVLSAELRVCSASRVGSECFSGRGWRTDRLCLTDPVLNRPEFYIAVKRGCSIIPWQHCPFTIQLDGREETVLLSRESLKRRLRVKERLIERAVKLDRLDMLVQHAWYLNVPRESRPQESFYFSKKDFEVENTIFSSGPELEAEIPKQLIDPLRDVGAHARVKEVWVRYPPGMPPAVLRKQLVKKGREDRADQLISNMATYCGRPNVIGLIGRPAIYEITPDKRQIFSVHPAVRKDLIDVLFTSEGKISPDAKINIGGQILRAIESLDGVHGDVKAQHFRIDPGGVEHPRTRVRENIWVIDLETRADFGAKVRSRGGTPNWMPPEWFDDSRPWDNSKAESWSTGILLLYLFLHPQFRELRWQLHKREDSIYRSLERNKGAYLDEYLLWAHQEIRKEFPTKHEEIYSLLRRMVEPDPAKRIPIQDAIETYRREIQELSLE